MLKQLLYHQTDETLVRILLGYVARMSDKIIPQDYII